MAKVLLSRLCRAVVFSIIPLCLFPYGVLAYHAFLVLDWEFYRHTGLHLQWQWLFYLREKAALKGSVSKSMVLRALASVMIVMGIELVFLWNFTPLPKGLLIAPALLLLWRQRFRFNKKKSSYKVDVQNEDYYRIDSNYPLLKYTTGFKGSELFSFPVDDQPHLIFISMESFASSQLRVAPCFNALKEQGLYFDQFYSVSTRSTPALIASHYGIPTHPQKMYDRQLVSSGFMGLPQMLKEKGYQTAFAHNGDITFEKNKALLQSHGFDSVWGYQQIVNAYPDATQQGWGIDDEHLYAYCSNWLQSRQSPCFLSLMTLTNHHPWHLPKTYSGPEFEDAPSDDHRRFWKTMHYSDAALQAFLDGLKQSGMDQRCVFFIFGDHGQALGEHRQSLIGRVDLFEESVHVPLLIFAPGRIAPNVISTPASQLDIPPTVMDLLSLQGMNSFVGSSLRRPLTNRPIFFSAPFKEGQHGMRINDTKIINDRKVNKTFSYDLSKDPNEANPQEIQPCLTLEGYHALIAQLHDEMRVCPKSDLDDLSIQDELSVVKDHTFGDCALDECSGQIQGLKLQATQVTDVGLKKFISRQPCLHCLVIADMPQITPEAFSLKKPHLCLRYFYLLSFQFSDSDLDILKHSFPNLNHFAMNIKNLSIPKLLAFFASLPNLRIITLEGCYDLCDDDIDQLLRNQKHLKILEIYKGNRLTDHTCYAVAKANLVSLHIDGALITNAGLKRLLNTNLHTLKATNCPLLTSVMGLHR
ncbi:MAG: sulfatase-like hydrolase/transferase [Chlamydiales bacterium]|nr:sulfatase-like hydrolase/transferase [Chlamydiales bacterium]